MIPSGVIRADEAYTVKEFRLRAQLGDYSWREIRKQLPIVKIGRKHYILGANWIKFLTNEQKGESIPRNE